MISRNIALVALLAVAFAQPHGQHFHRRHKREAVVIDTVTVVQTAPVAVVVVNQYGEVVTTSHREAIKTVAVAAETTIPTTHKHKHKHTHKPKLSSTELPSPTSTYTPEPSDKTTTSPPESSSADPTTASSTQSSTSTGASSSPTGALSGYGVSYSPYNADGTCRSADEVKSDFTNMKGFGYVRSYGVDCNQVPNILQAAKANNMKAMLGVFNIAQYSSELDTLISAVKANGGWDLVQAVSIGNEDVSSGKADVATVVSATNGGRAQLRSAGFDGPVVHVDVFNAILSNPELCESSDFVAANCHAFFNADSAAADAGSYVLSQAQQLKSKCGGKEVHITESGWPHQGNANGQAVPSPANQQAALDSLKSKFSSNLVFFSAYNNYWQKDNAYTFGAEHYWGIFGSGTSVKGF